MDSNKNGTNEERSKQEPRELEMLNVDTFLAEEVGQFGLHQMKTVAMIFIAAMFVNYHGAYVFITARIKTRCFVPECENTSKSEFAPSWLSNALPKSNIGFDECHRFTPNISFVKSATNQCSPQEFDNTTLLKCEKFIYENNVSLVYDFDLACDEWRRTLLGSAPLLVFFIALPLCGIISDIWGRKVALTIGAFNGGLIGILTYWSTSYNAYLAIATLDVFFAAGCYPSAYILAVETVGPKYRVLCSLIVGLADTIATIKLGFIAWAVEHWREISLFIYAPGMIILVLWFFYTESLRWYVSKGRYSDAEKLLKEMARVNKKTLSKNALKNLKKIIDEEQKQKALEKEERNSEPCLPILVFRHKEILIRCMITPVLWLGFVFIYYSLEANSVYLPGNKYVSYITSSLIEIPANIVAFIALSKMKRRVVLSGSFFVCAISQIVYIFTKDVSFSISLALFSVGKFSSIVMIQGVYLFTTELYPTKHRHSLLAFSSTVGRIGIVLAPLTPAFGDQVPFIMMSVLASFAGSIIFFLPETFNTVLPNTMEEASELKKKIKYDVPRNNVM